MRNSVKAYLSEIGRRGGKASRRQLTAEEARSMVRVREARRAFKRFHTHCFWSYNRDRQITLQDIDWVVDKLRRYGNREAWEVATRLCR